MATIKDIQSNKLVMNARVGSVILHPEYFNFYLENPKRTFEFGRFTFPASPLINLVERNAGKQLLITLEFLEEKKVIL